MSSRPFPEKVIISNTTSAIDDFLKEFRGAVLEPAFSNEKKRGLVEYVVFEALTNAWEHGNTKERKDRTITICCKNQKRLLILSIEDQGAGFPHTSASRRLPDLSRKRGRGLISMEAYASSLHYNDLGNKITIEFEKEQGMGQAGKVGTFKGQVIILKPVPSEGVKESLDELTDKICRLTMKLETAQKISLIIDLSTFNIVSSTLLGALGATIQEKSVRAVKLCGLKPAVLDTATRLGLIRAESGDNNLSKDIENNVYKIKVYSSLEEGVNSLIPSVIV